MMHNAVDDPVAFEINRELTVIPASDGWLADRGTLLVGQSEAFEYLIFGVATRGERPLGLALLADRDTKGVGMGRDAERKCQERDQ